MYIMYMHLVEDLTSNKISGIFGQIWTQYEFHIILQLLNKVDNQVLFSVDRCQKHQPTGYQRNLREELSPPFRRKSSPSREKFE